MTQPVETDKTKKGVPGRMSARVRLVLCALLIAAAAVGGGVWLSSHVDLGSAALSTVEQSAPEPAREEPVADGTEPADDEVVDETGTAPTEEAESGLPDGTGAESQEEPIAEGQAQDEPTVETVTVRQDYSAVEVQPEPEPEPRQTQPQPQQSQPQRQQSQPSQTNSSAQDQQSQSAGQPQQDGASAESSGEPTEEPG